MPFFPHSREEALQMLREMGLQRIEDLFSSIPQSLRLERPLSIPRRRTEVEILAEFERLAARNQRMDDRPCFLGAGSYHRFIPAAVDYLSSRGEFNTAYTPYQPEVSQGTLQAIFEYQSLICRVTGMEISNASMYEAATALAEAVLMAYAVKGSGRTVLLSGGVHPEYRRVLDTYLRSHPVSCVPLALSESATSPAAVEAALSDDTLAVVIQNPNFFGSIEDGKAIQEVLSRKCGQGGRPFFIAVVDPVSLGVLAPPGDYGADVAVGDGQGLGNYPAYGGPTLGFFATRMEPVRKLPGRIVGETRDREGKRGYVLTFQTREQHIRRERATSNICTNQGLCSLRAAMYLTCLGEEGFREAAEASTRKAHHAFARLKAIPGMKTVSSAPFYAEFPLRLPLDAETAYSLLLERGIRGGLPLGRYFPEKTQEMLFACTEMTRLEDISRLEEALAGICRTAPGSRGEAGS
jgi:glycine dehydrogenase subunit 1